MRSANAVAFDDDLCGSIIDQKFRIDELLGEGGIGRVYRATNLLLDRAVAIKVLRTEYEHNEEVVARFISEARAANMVRHQNVVDVLDFGISQSGAPYIVQELLVGETLSEYLRRKGQLSVRATLERLYPIINAMSFAHMRGLIHRDVKPENVFLAHQGGVVVPKVVDFGISKALVSDGVSPTTRAGVVMGTPAYMPPEQFHAFREIDARADVWALGVILYECMSGNVPFCATSMRVLYDEIAHQNPAPLVESVPEVPEVLDAIVMRCLEKDPDRRYRDAESLAEALKFFMRNDSRYKDIVGEDDFYIVNTSVAEVTGPQVQFSVAPKSGVRRSGFPSAVSDQPPSERRNETRAYREMQTPGEAPTATPRKSGVASQIKRTPLPLAPPRSVRVPVARSSSNVVPRSTDAPARPQSNVGSMIAFAFLALLVGAFGMWQGMRHRTRGGGTWGQSSQRVRLALNADISGVRALVRGHHYPVPFQIEVDPGSIEEIVLVSAPGYETQELRVALDRNVSLTVRMVPLTSEAPSY